MNNVCIVYTRKILLIIILFGLLVGSSTVVFSCPVSEEPFTLLQPDGTSFSAHLIGNEDGVGNVTVDGNYAIKQNESGWWYYMDNTGGLTTLVGESAPLSTYHQGLYKSQENQVMILNEYSPQSFVTRTDDIKTIGTLNIPVIPVTFNDYNPMMTEGDIHAVIFDDPNKNIEHGNVNEYYKEVSYNQLDVQGQVDNWVTVNHSRNYYCSPNDKSGLINLGHDAIEEADKNFNFSEYAINNDGYVDCVIIVYAGEGNLSCAPAFTYAYKDFDYQTNDPYIGSNVGKQGTNVHVGTWIIVPELRNFTYERTMTCGITCHEFAHALGILCDTYGDYGVGRWDLMSGGCYNTYDSSNPNYKNGFEGNSPAHLSAWEKATLGWITPIQITNVSNITLPAVETLAGKNGTFQLLDNPTGYICRVPNGDTSKFNTPYDCRGEYFLIENRNETGYDRALPESGLLIWHVNQEDFKKYCDGTWESRENDKLLDLEEADGLPMSDQHYTTDPWYSPLHTTFNSTSNPNSNYQNSSWSGVSVTSISAASSNPNNPMSAIVGIPLSGYLSMKMHNISGSADGALSDYQVQFLVHNTTGTDTARDIYLNGGSFSWPNDFRFTNSNNQKLSYWIESNNSTIAVVWVKVDSIAGGSSSTTPINVYYGKANDPGESNGDATFILFDDFNDNSINASKWVKVLGSSSANVTEQNHELELLSGSGSSSRPFLRTLNNYSGNYVVDVDARYSGSNGILVATDWNGVLTGQYQGPQNAYVNIFVGWGSPNKFWEITKQVSGVNYVLGHLDNNMNTNFHKLTIIQKPQAVLRVDGTTILTGNNDNTYSSGYVGLGGREGQNGIQTFYDNFRIRKYTANPPVSDAGYTLSMVTFIPTGPQYETSQYVSDNKRNNSTTSSNTSLIANGSNSS